MGPPIFLLTCFQVILADDMPVRECACASAHSREHARVVVWVYACASKHKLGAQGITAAYLLRQSSVPSQAQAAAHAAWAQQQHYLHPTPTEPPSTSARSLVCYDDSLSAPPLGKLPGGTLIPAGVSHPAGDLTTVDAVPGVPAISPRTSPGEGTAPSTAPRPEFPEMTQSITPGPTSVPPAADRSAPQPPKHARSGDDASATAAVAVPVAKEAASPAKTLPQFVSGTPPPGQSREHTVELARTEGSATGRTERADHETSPPSPKRARRNTTPITEKQAADATAITAAPSMGDSAQHRASALGGDAIAAFDDYADAADSGEEAAAPPSTAAAPTAATPTSPPASELDVAVGTIPVAPLARGEPATGSHPAASAATGLASKAGAQPATPGTSELPGIKQPGSEGAILTAVPGTSATAVATSGATITATVTKESATVPGRADNGSSAGDLGPGWVDAAMATIEADSALFEAMQRQEAEEAAAAATAAEAVEAEATKGSSAASADRPTDSVTAPVEGKAAIEGGAPFPKDAEGGQTVGGAQDTSAPSREEQCHLGDGGIAEAVETPSKMGGAANVLHDGEDDSEIAAAFEQASAQLEVTFVRRYVIRDDVKRVRGALTRQATAIVDSPESFQASEVNRSTLEFYLDGRTP